MTMDIQLIVALIFFTFLTIFVLKNKKKVQFQKIVSWVIYFVMYKTKTGLKFMDKTAKNFSSVVKGFSYFGLLLLGIWVFNDYANIISSFLKIFLLTLGLFVCFSLIKNPHKNIQYVMVYTGFLGMGLIVYELIKNIIKLFTDPQIAAQSVGLVLPFQVKGAFYVPFTYWIISIFILAVVHEGSHGVLARLFNIKIKSSGFAFLGIGVPVLPAAFVEPDEKQLEKSKPLEQMTVFAAGPFANILLGFLVLLVIAVLLPPIVNQVVDNDGILVSGLLRSDNNETLPAELAGIQSGELIIAMDGIDMFDAENFSEYLGTKGPGDNVVVTTNVSEYSLTLGVSPSDSEQGYMGVQIGQHTKLNEEFVDKYGEFSAKTVFWFSGLLFWLYILNIGIGLFNLVPLGPVDGGRMLRTFLLQYYTKQKAEKIWKNVSSFFLFIILVMILSSFIVPHF